MDAISIVPNLPPPIGYNRISPSNCRRFISKRNRISAVDEVSAITYDPVAPQITWQIIGIGGGLRRNEDPNRPPCFDGGDGHGGRWNWRATATVAQKKCIECGGSGLVLIEKEYIRCPNCGGFLPWQSWKRFFSG
ncbi:hypothetical protein R6Q57_006520 [Mikania cordata]